MHHIETTRTSKFEAPHRPTANMPDAQWHLNFAELMVQFRRLGARALSHHKKHGLASLPISKIRQMTCSKDAQRAERMRLLGLQRSLHEFAAFSTPNAHGQTLLECALMQADALPAEVQAYLPALSASTWDLYEVVEICPGGPTSLGARAGGVCLRRLFDDAAVQVTAPEAESAPRLGEIAAWRVFDAGGFLAAPQPLPLPSEEIAAILSQLTLEASQWKQGRGGRELYLRERGNLLMINHCIRSAKHRFCPQVEPATPRQVEGLVSPAESELPPDSWRRLAQAFSVLEISATGWPTALFPRPFEVADGGILCVEQAANSWVATLFESAPAYQEWRALQHTLAQPDPTRRRCARATPQLRSWRARPEELDDSDIRLLSELRLKPLRDGAALAVGLDADWRWHDLDMCRTNRLIDALHTAAKQLRTGEGLAA